MEKDLIKAFGGLVSIALPHCACLISGVYKGSMNAQGMEVDIPFRYLWGANILITAIAKPLLNENISCKREVVFDTMNGATIGTIAAPIEYVSGYTIGYICGWISDKAFF